MEQKLDFCVVTKPYTDLRKSPVDVSASTTKDELQETQLVYNEFVMLTAEEDGWSLVSAIEQPVYYQEKKQWIGYPGWVRSSTLAPMREDFMPNTFVTSPWATIFLIDPEKESFEVPMGSRLHVLNRANGKGELLLSDGSLGWIDEVHLQSNPQEKWREDVIHKALSQLGTTYHWGGRTVQKVDEGEAFTGFDCSGLVNLLYRLYHGSIPRNSSDLARYVTPIKAKDLQPADLIFSAPVSDDGSSTVDHVMIFMENELLIESTATTGTIRACTFKERFGVTQKDMIKGVPSMNFEVSFGQAPIPPSK